MHKEKTLQQPRIEKRRNWSAVAAVRVLVEAVKKPLSRGGGARVEEREPEEGSWREKNGSTCTGPLLHRALLGLAFVHSTNQ
jgi:hypothetical protein